MLILEQIIQSNCVENPLLDISFKQIFMNKRPDEEEKLKMSLVDKLSTNILHNFYSLILWPLKTDDGSCLILYRR